MAARGSKARKKDKRRRHANARKVARDQTPAFQFRTSAAGSGRPTAQ